jgi:hypothetical protein
MQFLFPGFLFSFVLLAIPILIHLFNFRRYKRIVFSDIRFLRELTQQNKKQQTVKHYLILAARILALSALILSFAQPFIPTDNTNQSAGGKRVNIYVDNSPSMEAMAGNGNLFNLAKENAIRLMEGYSDKDEFQVLSNDFEGKHQRWFKKKEAIATLEALKPSGVYRTANEVLARQKSLYAGAAFGEAFWFSDFQQNFNLGQLSLSDSLLRLFPVKLEASKQNNVWIDSAWFPEPVLKIGSSNKIKVRVRNGGENAWENQAVTLKIEGIQKGLKNITCAPGSSETVELDFSLNHSKPQAFEISITDFPIVFDDTYFLTGAAVSKINILEIGAKQPMAALGLVYSLDSAYAYAFQELNQLNFSAFGQQQLIVLNQVAEVSSALADALSNYLQQGGLLLFIPPTLPSASLTLWLSKEGIVLNQLQNSIQVLDKPELKHPILAKVFAKFPQMPNMPSVKQWFGYQLNVPHKAILSLGNGAPWLSEIKKGAGSLYLFGSNLNTSNTDFTRNALFVPILLNMPLLARNPIPNSFYLGKETQWHVDNTIDAKVIQLKGEGREYRADVRNFNNKQFASLNDRIEKAGVYEVLVNEKTAGKVAFNYPRAESLLNFYSATDLEETFKTSLSLASFDSFLVSHQAANKGNFLWQYFLWAALLFLITEVLIIRFMK